jgi:hypothetical protein
LERRLRSIQVWPSEGASPPRMHLLTCVGLCAMFAAATYSMSAVTDPGSG